MHRGSQTCTGQKQLIGPQEKAELSLRPGAFLKGTVARGSLFSSYASHTHTHTHTHTCMHAMGQSSAYQRGPGGGGWHKALVVGSVSLWRRLLASRL